MKKWSSDVADFFKRLFTFNIVNCFWFIWAAVSGFVFLVFSLTKADDLVKSLVSKDTNFCVGLTECINETFFGESFLSIMLLVIVVLGGVLGIGFIVSKILFFVLDSIEQVIGGGDE